LGSRAFPGLERLLDGRRKVRFVILVAILLSEKSDASKARNYPPLDLELCHLLLLTVTPIGNRVRPLLDRFLRSTDCLVI
jgi:hypothetical protein